MGLNVNSDYSLFNLIGYRRYICGVLVFVNSDCIVHYDHRVTPIFYLFFFWLGIFRNFKALNKKYSGWVDMKGNR